MPLTVETLPIPGPLLLHTARHEDARGCFAETYHRQELRDVAGIDCEFVQDNFSLSKPVGVVRGLHFQVPPRSQGKLVRVLRGAALDVLVDLRQGSPCFGRHVAIELSAENWQQLWIPPGFAHGFCTLQPDTMLTYKVTAFYAPAQDRGLAWDDPDLGIAWPVAAGAAILSDKDRANPRLRDLPAWFG